MTFDEKNKRLLQALSSASQEFFKQKAVSADRKPSAAQIMEYQKLLHLWQEALEDYYQFFREIE